MKRVIVHIDRLVLKRFRAEDRQAIALGLQQELQRIFADRQTVSTLKAAGDVSRLKVAGVEIEHGAKPRRIGQKVARGIGKELGK
jgi:hypothetical protein